LQGLPHGRAGAIFLETAVCALQDAWPVGFLWSVLTGGKRLVLEQKTAAYAS